MQFIGNEPSTPGRRILIVELEEKQQIGGKGRPKRNYSLTELGKQKFFELMEKPLFPYHLETNFVFRIKLLYLNWISLDSRIRCLQDYWAYCQFVEEYVRNYEDEVKQNPDIGIEEKQQTLMTFSYRMNGILSEQAWLKNEIKKLQRGI